MKLAVLLNLFTINLFLPLVLCKLEFRYHKNDELIDYLHQFVLNYPNISEVYSIGQSVNGYDLTVIKLTTSTDDLAPNVKFIGNIHGNEAIGREILLQFVEYIGNNHLNDSRIVNLLKTTVIHILPTLNPDGFDISNVGCDGMKGRNNGHDVDLNRNFPDYYVDTQAVQEPETKAVKEWMNNVTFSLSASLHSGALVANYPFDSPKDQVSRPYPVASLAPDDDILKHLALVYARTHPQMHMGNSCNARFPNGITNGAEWYEFSGGMQDYNYAFRGTMELTLELSCCKYPMTKNLPAIWNANKMSLIELASQANMGLRGIIVDYDKYSNSNVSLMIRNRTIFFYPDSRGRFWRILLPGKYFLKVIIEGQPRKLYPFIVRNNTLTTLHVNLTQALLVDKYFESTSVSSTTSFIKGLSTTTETYFPTRETALADLYKRNTTYFRNSASYNYLSNTVACIAFFFKLSVFFN